MKRLLCLLCCLSLFSICPPAQGAPTRKEIASQIDGKKKSIEAVKKRIKTREVRIKMHKACRDLHPEYYSGCSYYYSTVKTKVVIGGGAVCDGHIHKIREYDPVSGRAMTVSHGCPWRTGGKLQDGIHQAISKLELDNRSDYDRISVWEVQIAELTDKLQECAK